MEGFSRASAASNREREEFKRQWRRAVAIAIDASERHADKLDAWPRAGAAAVAFVVAAADAAASASSSAAAAAAVVAIAFTKRRRPASKRDAAAAVNVVRKCRRRETKSAAVARCDAVKRPKRLCANGRNAAIIAIRAKLGKRRLRTIGAS